MDLTDFIVTPQCFDPDAGKNGNQDDTAALRAWLDDPRPIKLLPTRRAATASSSSSYCALDDTHKIGPYQISSALEHTRGNIAIVGLGNRNSIIRVKTNTTLFAPMLTLGREDTVTGGYVLKGFALVGSDFNDDDAPNNNSAVGGGLVLRFTHFCELSDVGIRDIESTGLLLDGVQDSYFYGIDVRKCGVFDSAPACWIKHHRRLGFPLDDFDSNGLKFIAGDFERNRYTACLLDKVYAIGFQGTKFHGRTKKGTLPEEQVFGDDSDNPKPVDLLVLEGAKRVTVIGCTFAHARKNAIWLKEDENDVPSFASVVGCTFTEAVNYGPDTGSSSSSSSADDDDEAWYVKVDAARAMIGMNLFDVGHHASYTELGGDVWVTSLARDAGGMNMHIRQRNEQEDDTFAAHRFKYDAETLYGKWNSDAIEICTYYQWVKPAHVEDDPQIPEFYIKTTPVDPGMELPEPFDPPANNEDGTPIGP
jgi:hypothetical protein